MMKRIKIKSTINDFILNVKDNYLLIIIFAITNTINGLLLRIITIKSGLRLSAILVDFGIMLILGIISLLFKKKKKRIKYLFIVSVVATLICLINSIYYHYYTSFASISFLATATFAKDVSDAILENVLKPIDLIYLWQPLFLYFHYRKNKEQFHDKRKIEDKKFSKILILFSIIIMGIGALTMPVGAWGSLHKLWNRESIVANYGPYVYQIDDTVQCLTPKINTIFGHDSALRKTKIYYQEHKAKKENNEYTNIFEGKNVLVIHAESIQKFVMDLKFNNEEVTPNLNKLAREGIFFSNFYSQVGVGTSSDAEFTFNTSLMPSSRGTVFVNYFDRRYISLPNLLKEKGYYTFSMHANNGEFWNRNIMHENLGYNKFYSKDSYIIDETIGLGLSDKSFFNQSVDIIKNIQEEQNNPFYGLLIMLSNHTPFNDFNLIDEFPTTENIEIDGEIITREYINNTKLGNYIRTVHYADQAIGDFISKLDENGLLENTVIVIYGDHDARLPFDDFNLLYNYDPENDEIRTEEDEKYKVFNNYEYEINRKVPFIIWAKDGQYNKNVSTPAGMIDALPTLGNMLGVSNKYQMGTDIFNIKNGDNTVTFTDGSFITSKIYYNAPKGEIYTLNNEAIAEEYINLRVNHSSELIEVSNDIIYYDLINELENH